MLSQARVGGRIFAGMGMRKLFRGICLAAGAVAICGVLPQGVAQRPSATALRDSSDYAALPLRSIGPSIFSGRVVDLAVDPDTPTHFVVAFATGGLWETRNNGRSFVSLFEGVTAASLGALAVDWAARRIYLGTGESNSSRSSYAGDGLYVSDDWGRTWAHRGLRDTRHIAKIALDPRDPDRLLVAALGGLYTPDGARGVYRSADAGRTWTATLPTSGWTGAVDLARDPRDPDRVYAATWERERHAWDFREAGPGSAVYRSSDGGITWKRLGGGLPADSTTGRIGLSAVDSAGETTLYAVVDNQARRPVEPGADGLTLRTLGDMSGDIFAQIDSATLAKLLADNDFPLERYPLDSIRAEVRAGRMSPRTIREFLTDANAQLFDTPVVGAEVYRSDDGGTTWRRAHAEPLDDLFYSYGYYFAQVRAQPGRPSRVYVLGVPAIRSDDGGKTWAALASDNAHADHHALWLDPRDPGHLVLGNDGGINVSYDAGATMARAVSPPAGQFYAVAVDDARPYRAYGGTQDNGVWRVPHDHRPDVSWEMDGDAPVERLLGGDGMQVAIDPRDNATVYTGFQFGHYFRIDPDGSRTDVKPRHRLGERPLRFNWQTPIWLSTHNADVLYIGSNKLHRSLDRGATYPLQSADLTHGGRSGDVPYGTLTTIHESPRRFGLVYVGTDDGRVHVSPDGGYTLVDISAGLAPGKWVSRVQASHHALDRVYVTLNGYRDDDPTPYVYVSEDRGQHWRAIDGGLPAEPINDILEDSRDSTLLYLATDGGVYVSDDSGDSWSAFGDLPLVPVHDLAIQERTQELLVGTHGRSLFVGDLSAVRSRGDSVGARELFVYTPPAVTRGRRWGEPWSRWASPDTPTVTLNLYSDRARELRLEVRDSKGTVVQRAVRRVPRGFSDLRVPLTVSEDLEDAAAKRYPLGKDQRRYWGVGAYVLELAPVGSRRGGRDAAATVTVSLEAPKSD